MQENRDQAYLIEELKDSGATPEEIQEALQEVLKQNEGNFFIQ